MAENPADLNAANKTVIIDARSLSHLFYMLSLLDKKTIVKNCVLIWPRPSSQIQSIRRIVPLPDRQHFISQPISDRALMFNRRANQSIKDGLRSLGQIGSNTIILTSYNHGLYFELLCKYLNISDDSVYLFDDGVQNLMKIKNRMLPKSILYAFHGIFKLQSQYRLGHDRRLNHFFTIFETENNLKNTSHLVPVDISEQVKGYFIRLYEKHIAVDLFDNSALVLSHHAVESGRMTLTEYQSLFSKIIKKITELGVSRIYISKHHMESDVNDEFYNSLGLKRASENLPAELLLCGNKIKVVAQPFNSVIPVSENLSILRNVECVISYRTPASPNIKERVELVKKILNHHEIKHVII